MIWTTQRRQWTVTYLRDSVGGAYQRCVVCESMHDARDLVDSLIMDEHVKHDTIRIGQTGSVLIDRSK